MTTRVCEAIYRDGTFRPIDPIPDISEGQQVRLVVEASKEPDILALAAKVYEGLSAEDISDIERIALDRSNFFTARS